MRARGARAIARALAVDAEVGVHELDNRAVAVEALAQRLADEVPLVDDLVRRPQPPKRLLRQLGDVVRRPRLRPIDYIIMMII